MLQQNRAQVWKGQGGQEEFTSLIIACLQCLLVPHLQPSELHSSRIEVMHLLAPHQEGIQRAVGFAAGERHISLTAHQSFVSRLLWQGAVCPGGDCFDGKTQQQKNGWGMIKP